MKYESGVEFKFNTIGVAGVEPRGTSGEPPVCTRLEARDSDSHHSPLDPSRPNAVSVFPRLLIVALGLSLLLTQPSPAAPPKFPAPPRLATTAEELNAARQQADFAAVRERAVKAANALVASPVPLPAGYGSWVFYYACPDDGAGLQMVALDEHVCPRCKQKYTDDRTVAAYRCLMHHKLEHSAVSLGWAYAYTGDEKYAAQVKRILLHLADHYATYPARLDRWGRKGVFAPLGGRRYVQSLDEAVGVIRLAKGYDLTRASSVWSDAERKHVEEDFFRATAKTLLVFNQGINNHQTWYNAGLMAIASVLADAALVERVLTMRGGFHDQLRRSLGEDGLWYEGTMAYQNYALQAMVEIVDAGRRMGLDLHRQEKFKKLLVSPLRVAYPNGQFPCINDSDPSNLRSFAWSFDWAWRVYREPRFAQAAAWGNPKKLAALLGPDAKPAPLTSTSENLADLGLAVLRVGEGAASACVFHDYGRHGGGHGHYDKLNITLFAGGREWLFDTGRIGYTHKEYKSWVKHTAAHNTVVLNRANQRATQGKLLWLTSGKGYTACASECKTAYFGAALRRYLCLSEKWLVDVFDVRADKRVEIDWLAHAVTQPVVPVDEMLQAEPTSLGEGPGYNHLTNPQQWPVHGDSAWDFVAGTGSGAKRLRVWLPHHSGEQVITAIGIGHYPTEKAPCLIRRRTATGTQFATVYDLTGDGAYITGVVAQSDSPKLTVRTTDGNVEIEFSEEGVVLGQ